MFFCFFFNGMGRNPGQTHTLERLQKAWEHLGVSPPETLEVVGEEREAWASPAQIDAK